MKTQKRLQTIKKQIDKIKQQLALFEDMRPGSLTLQYRDPKTKTGPFYQISYTLERKSRSETVRPSDVKILQNQIKKHHQFKKLTATWTALAIEQSQLKLKSSES